MRLSQFILHMNDLFQDYMVKDYCVNGLQIGDTKADNEIHKIVSGVTLEKELLERAINESADAILVHHGLFWNYQNHEITGLNYEKVKMLVDNGIALFGYHLPLDFHAMVGNNAVLFKSVANKLDIGYQSVGSPDEKNPVSVFEFLGGEITAGQVVEALAQVTGQEVGDLRTTLNRGCDPDKVVKSVGICTGGGQNYFRPGQYDAYITGEAGLPQMIQAKENGLLFAAAGHHNTEVFGVKALGEYIEDKFGIRHVFHNIPVDA